MMKTMIVLMIIMLISISALELQDALPSEVALAAQFIDRPLKSLTIHGSTAASP